MTISHAYFNKHKDLKFQKKKIIQFYRLRKQDYEESNVSVAKEREITCSLRIKRKKMCDCIKRRGIMEVWIFPKCLEKMFPQIPMDSKALG